MGGLLVERSAGQSVCCGGSLFEVNAGQFPKWWWIRSTHWTDDTDLRHKNPMIKIRCWGHGFLVLQIG